jgi:hypothetical protein
MYEADDEYPEDVLNAAMWFAEGRSLTARCHAKILLRRTSSIRNMP